MNGDTGVSIRFPFYARLSLIALFALLLGCQPSVTELEGLGGHAMNMKDWAAATVHLEQAVERDPTRDQAFRSLANCRVMLGDREGAAEALHALLRIRPDDCKAHLLLAQYAAEQERWDDAVRHIICANRLAQFRDELQQTRYWLDAIRSAAVNPAQDPSSASDSDSSH